MGQSAERGGKSCGEELRDHQCRADHQIALVAMAVDDRADRQRQHAGIAELKQQQTDSQADQGGMGEDARPSRRNRPGEHAANRHVFMQFCRLRQIAASDATQGGQGEGAKQGSKE